MYNIYVLSYSQVYRGDNEIQIKVQCTDYKFSLDLQECCCQLLCLIWTLFLDSKKIRNYSAILMEYSKKNGVLEILIVANNSTLSKYQLEMVMEIDQKAVVI